MKFRLVEPRLGKPDHSRRKLPSSVASDIDSCVTLVGHCSVRCCFLHLPPANGVSPWLPSSGSRGGTTGRSATPVAAGTRPLYRRSGSRARWAAYARSARRPRCSANRGTEGRTSGALLGLHAAATHVWARGWAPAAGRTRAPESSRRLPRIGRLSRLGRSPKNPRPRRKRGILFAAAFGSLSQGASCKSSLRLDPRSRVPHPALPVCSGSGARSGSGRRALRP